MKHRLGLVEALVVVAMASGCAKDDVSFDEPEVGIEGQGDPGGASYCLDAKDPAVHYESDDPVQCKGVALRCAEGQYGFDNACGCGCIDKAALSCPATLDDTHIRWVSRRAEDCAGAPACELGELAFSNSCGCGCIQH
jgi:hypothetical protein